MFGGRGGGDFFIMYPLFLFFFLSRPGVRKYTCWNGTCTGEVFTNKKTIENHIKKFHEATIVVSGVYKQENYRKSY